MMVLCWALPICGGMVLDASAQSPLDGGKTSTGIATDRPAITDSSVVVPYRVFQAENGWLDTGGQPRRTPDFPETLIRVGIAPNTELRFTAPDYFHDSVTPGGPRSGFGDLMVGIKQQLRSARDGFESAAVLSLSFPTGTAAGMLSVYAPTQNGSHSIVGESTLLFDRQLTNAWDAFTEYAGDFPQAGEPRHLLHFGTSYKIASQQQLDLHVGVGLSPAAVDHFFGIGYSFRFRIARP